MSNSVETPKRDVIVTSFGGVGTSPFLTWLAPKLSCNCPSDTDGLKHSINPHNISQAANKFVFIHGDPVEAILSLYSRKYIRPQFKKLTGSDNKVSLEQYAESGEDLLGYKRQLDSWLSYKEKPVLFLRYPNFWSNEQRIIDYLGLPSHTKLFQKKDRTSKKSDLPTNVLLKLERIYQPLNSVLDELGDFHLA